MTDSNLDKTLVLIPARMASTRLPGKPLADICGLPMIVQVAKRAREAAIGRIVVAVDHDDTYAAVANAGFEVVMTRQDHQSGSDRIHEALRAVDPDGRVEIIVNVQGDLPTIDPQTIHAALRPLDNPAVDIGTLTVEIKDEEEKPCRASSRSSAQRCRKAACARSILRAPPLLTARGRSIITSASTPIVAQHWRNSSASARRRSNCANRWSNCGRWKPACASMSRSLTRSRSVSILPPTSKRPDASFPAPLADGISPLKAVP